MSVRRLRIAYSDDAQADLGNILMYTDREWGESQRAAYERILRDAISTLSRNPLLGRARGDLAEGVRSYPVGSHVVYYWELHDTLFSVHRPNHAQPPGPIQGSMGAITTIRMR